MSKCSVCGTTQGPFKRGLGISGRPYCASRVVQGNRRVLVDDLTATKECLARRDKLDVNK